MTGIAARTEPAGLTSRQAADRLAADGPNEVPPVRPVGWPTRVGRQLLDPLLLLLLASAAVTAALGDLTDMAVILLVIVVNTTVGVSQEVRADRAIAALHQLAATTARVRRDGTDQVVPTRDVVRGDLLVLAAGDVVPADAIVVRAQQFRLDESAVTGESVPLAREPGEELSAGTTVVAGRARAEVTRTGPASALGRIATLVAADQSGGTPLQRRLRRLGQQLGLAVVVLSALVVILGVAAGRPVAQMAITGVSLVVAAIPESLPAVVTLALALGAMRMARGHAIARRLHAVETLGSVTVLAVDKTGTLTEGRMVVERVLLTDGSTVPAAGHGYDPTASPRLTGPTGLTELARAVVLCNDARLVPPTADRPEWSVAGDPVEGALLAFAGRCGIDDSAARAEAVRRAEEPFDASIRRMTTVHTTTDGLLVVCKGAPEVLLEPAITAMPPEQRAALRAAARDMADEGLRLLAVATGQATDVTSALPPRDLTLLGLIGIHDPVRSAAPAVTKALADAGIRLVMITGDHPATAGAVARQLGSQSSTSDEVEVFARVRPEQKLDIVQRLQSSGEIVAMTGDGVNDAPALRRADIGVAMGRGGTDVARQAADLILADDNLATVTVAVREGRRIYDNIRRFLRYGLAGGLAEILVMLIGPAGGLALPLLPAQILWVNLLTHGLPGVALGAEPAEPGTMHRRPRPPRESVLGDGLAASVLVIGVIIAAVVLSVGLAAYRAGGPWQSMAFVTLGLAQLGVALAVRAHRSGSSGNVWLGVAVAVSALLQVAAVQWRPLRILLETETLSIREWGLCVAAAAVPGLAVAVARRINFRKPGGPS